MDPDAVANGCCGMLWTTHHPRPSASLGLRCDDRERSPTAHGNALLCFTLWAVLELALIDGFAVLEDPAEPEDAPNGVSGDCPSCKFYILAMPHGSACTAYSLRSGLDGFLHPEPTHLLVVNLPGLMLELRKELARQAAIGKTKAGAWRTTVLKEYAPSFFLVASPSLLFRHLTNAMWISPKLPHLMHSCIAKDMVCTEYGQAMGGDYASLWLRQNSSSLQGRSDSYSGPE